MRKSNGKIVVAYNSPIKLQDELLIRLTIANDLGYVKDCKVLFNTPGREPGSEGECYMFYNTAESSNEISIFDARFKFDKPGYKTFIIELKVNDEKKRIGYSFDTNSAEFFEDGKPCEFWETFVYYSWFKTPDEIKGGIMYQIFVDTFYKEDIKNLPDELKNKMVSWSTYPKWQPDDDGEYRNDQFYGGNIQGIISKLDYIKSLGTTIIYLTPIFESPSQNGYDISDYTKVSEMMGTWDDIDELREKAHERGMLLIQDTVFNHSSSENKLIKEDPEMYDWIEKYTKPKCWWGFEGLTEFNKYSINYFKNLEQWLRLYYDHFDGIRLDVADCLPDFVLKFIKRIFHDKYVLGEVWKHAVTGEYREFVIGDECDGVMNYQYPNAIFRYLLWGNSPYYRRIIESVYNLYPYEALSVSPIFLSSHDIPRTPSIMYGVYMQPDINVENTWGMENSNDWLDKNGKYDTFKFRKWEVEHENDLYNEWNKVFSLTKLAVFFQYTLPGLPSIFAGDEVGVIGYKDPTNRKPFPWDNVNEEVLKFYKEIGLFRIKNREVFAEDNFELISVNDGVVIYKRGEITFIVNRSEEDIDVSYYKTEIAKFVVGKFDKERKVLGPLSAIAF